MAFKLDHRIIELNNYLIFFMTGPKIGICWIWQAARSRQTSDSTLNQLNVELTTSKLDRFNRKSFSSFKGSP